MKVLVCPCSLQLGGSEINAVDLAAAVQQRGHEAVVFGRPGPLAERARDILGGDIPVDGTTNETCAAGAELLFVTVPYAGQAEIYRSIKPHVPEGRIVVDTTTPLASANRNQLKVHGLNAWDAIKAYIQYGIRPPISPVKQITSA